MDKLLEKCNLLRLNQDEIENMNRTIKSTEIKIAFKIGKMPNKLEDWPLNKIAKYLFISNIEPKFEKKIFIVGAFTLALNNSIVFLQSWSVKPCKNRLPKLKNGTQIKQRIEFIYSFIFSGLAINNDKNKIIG